MVPDTLMRVGRGRQQWKLEDDDYLLDICQASLDHMIVAADLDLEEDILLTTKDPIYRVVSFISTASLLLSSLNTFKTRQRVYDHRRTVYTTSLASVEASLSETSREDWLQVIQSALSPAGAAFYANPDEKASFSCMNRFVCLTSN
jgi:hypothetical protein